MRMFYSTETAKLEIKFKMLYIDSSHPFKNMIQLLSIYQCGLDHFQR